MFRPTLAIACAMLLAASGSVRAEDAVSMPPHLISGQTPVHPEGPGGQALRFRAVVHIDAEGEVLDVHVPAHVPDAFRLAAEDALRASTFAPARIDGQPVVGETVIEIIFDAIPEDVGDAVLVYGRLTEPPRASVSDIEVDASQAAITPRSAEDVLRMVPGLLISRYGSEADPPVIFLRGFDARHGQDIQFRMDGMPLNQVGNPHGHGMVDLHHIPPEALSGLRAQEGVYDASQGDFAVAGTVDLRLGMEEPGLMLRGQGGSFQTGRAMTGWRHPEQSGTFAIADVESTRGFGANRAMRRGRGLIRMEVPGPTKAVMQAGIYTGAWDHAGLVRQADVDAGRIDLYGTHDRRQFASTTHGWAALSATGELDRTTWTTRASFAARRMRRADNFTGFLLDDPRPGEADHPQRGDLLEISSTTRTAHFDAWTRTAWEGPVRTAIEAGAFGRYDHAEGLTERLRDADGAPYRTEQDYTLHQGNVGVFATGELRTTWLTLRGGLRVASFIYDLTDHCAASDAWFPGTSSRRTDCFDEDRRGLRRPHQGRLAQGIGVAPRLSSTFHLPGEHRIALAGGRGLRSMEALALSDREDAPFGELWSAELGWERPWRAGDLTLMHRLVGFTTHLQRELLFDEERGANVYAGNSARYGAMLDLDLAFRGLTVRGSLTYTHAVFGDELPPSFSFLRSDRQPGMLIPYVPPWVGRVDAVHRYTVGPVQLRSGLGLTYIAPRPLPQSERSALVAVLDAGQSVRWRGMELGLTVTNLLNQRYPLFEGNYSSWFPNTSGTPFPTRVASRHVSPGPPLAALATLTLWPQAFQGEVAP